MAESTRRITRQHRSGNSFSVRIPRDMAWPDPNQELEIEAIGETMVLRPKSRLSIPDMLKQFDGLRALGAQGPDDNALIRPDVPNPYERV